MCLIYTHSLFGVTGFGQAGFCQMPLLWQGRATQRFGARQAVIINCVPKLDFVRNFYQISGCLFGLF